MATLRDAVYGAVVGDALGVPYEFMERGLFHAAGMTDHGINDQPAEIMIEAYRSMQV